MGDFINKKKKQERYQTDSMSTKTEFEVDMMCDGCARAVKGVLSRVNGVDSIEVSWENNQVIVEGTADPNEMLEAIKKTGKNCRLKQKETPLFLLSFFFSFV